MEQQSRYGTTSSCIAYATWLSIQHNIKVLLITTSFNDKLINESFWSEQKKKSFGFLGKNYKTGVDTNGIVGLDRMIRSNKLSPDIITDYAQIVLTNRLEIIAGVQNSKEQYDSVKEKYAQIITQAGKYYDMVVVDLNRSVGKQAEIDILNASDIVVPLVPQRAKKIEEIKELIDKGEILKEKNVTISTCESVTGGMIASFFASVPGASAVFKGGSVVYSNFAKMLYAKVQEKTLNQYGAISANTVTEMALNTAKLTKTDICIAISGNAGPICDENKPMGFAYLGICVIDKVHVFELQSSQKERNNIRIDFANLAFDKLLSLLKDIRR